MDGLAEERVRLTLRPVGMLGAYHPSMHITLSTTHISFRFVWLLVTALGCFSCGHGADTGAAQADAGDDTGKGRDGAPDAALVDGAVVDARTQGLDAGDGGTVAACTSDYLRAVTIPLYDPDNSEHFLIRSAADWDRVNDTDKRVFFVAPGDYGVRVLRTSGVAGAPRILALYRADDRHPAALPEADQANVSLKFSGADYWVVDRLSGIGDATDFSVVFTASRHNVLNRMLWRRFGRGAVHLISGSHDNTIQLSRAEDMTEASRRRDGNAIQYTGSGSQWAVHDTRIVCNEIANCSGGIALLQPQRGGAYLPVDYRGTIIDNNHFYIEPSIYTDCNGTPDPAGACAYAENAIDVKAGSDLASAPVRITNNIMWGFRRADSTGSSLSDNGAAIVLHYGVKNLVFDNNVIFDSNQGFAVVNKAVYAYSAFNVSVRHNLFYKIGGEDRGGPAVILRNAATQIHFVENVIAASPWSRWWLFTDGTRDSEVRCNILADTRSASGRFDSTNDVRDNAYYGLAALPDDASPRAVDADPMAANLRDFSFVAERLGTAGRDVTLRGARPAESWSCPQ